MRPAVAIIGAGVSGALTALHLLAKPAGPRVFLIEKRAGFGTGVAYATPVAGHVLNVRAGNMSAFPDRPDDFVRWLRARDGTADAGSFAPRRAFGEYIGNLLREAAGRPEAVGRLFLVPDEAVGLRHDHGPFLSGRLKVTLAMGRELAADAAVLATGNPPPEPPAVAEPALLASPHYIADPWVETALDTIGPRDPVLLLGTGLTMVDVVLTLEALGHRGPRIALSRRGLLPRRHGRPHGPVTAPSLPPLLSGALASVRAASQAAPEKDWRLVIDSLRPQSRALWRGLGPVQQRRFLRHLRPWWDTHRHRLAPPVAAEFDRLMARGRMRVAAGHLTRLALDGDGVDAAWRGRRSDTIEAERFRTVVNCMGPGGDPSRSTAPLIQALLASGMARPDPLRLGLEVDEVGHLIGRDGTVDPIVLTLGPPTRGTFWEISAVPDIRTQTIVVADAIAARLGPYPG